MVRRIRRVGGLGEGGRLRKSIDLAITHPKINFVAVEKAEASRLSHFEYLRKKGHKVKPANLTIKTGIAAEKYLAGEPPNSFGHLYAHFLLQHMSFADRRKLFSEIWRTLSPASNFLTIEDIH